MTVPDPRMELLRQRFHGRAVSDREAIVTALRKGDRERLLYLSHGLAGIAAIFGYADVSARASVLEEGVEKAVDEAVLAELGQALIAALDEFSLSAE